MSGGGALLSIAALERGKEFLLLFLPWEFMKVLFRFEVGFEETAIYTGLRCCVGAI